MNNPLIIPNFFSWFFLILNFVVGTLPYLKGIATNQIFPNLSSWIIWCITPLLSVYMSLNQSSGLFEILPLVIASIGPLLVIFFAIKTQNYYNESWRIDLGCLLFNVFSLYIYLMYRSSVFSQLILAVVYGVSCFPTILKLVKNPKQKEYLGVYGFAILAWTIGIFSIPKWTFDNSFFLCWMIFVTIIIGVCIVFKSKPKNPKVA
jgi:hypothetical protein